MPEIPGAFSLNDRIVDLSCCVVNLFSPPMWNCLVTKVDIMKDPKNFWKEINRMRGLRGAGGTQLMRDENGRELNNEREEAEAFKGRMERTFNISERENQNFNEDTEDMVRMWHLVYRDTYSRGHNPHRRGKQNYHPTT